MNPAPPVTTTFIGDPLPGRPTYDHEEVVLTS
jgi:hypothetical protein